MKVKQEVYDFIIGDIKTESAGNSEDGLFSRAFKKKKVFRVDKIFNGVRKWHISRKGTARKNRWFEYYKNMLGVHPIKKWEGEIEVERVVDK